MSRVICIGECMVELRPIEGRTLQYSFAGDAFNTAVYLKRSAPEMQVSFLSATGDEELSEELRETLKTEGLDDAWLFRVPHSRPALYLIRIVDGDRHFSYWRADSPARQWLRELLAAGSALLDQAELVYLSGISLAILNPADREGALEVLRATRARVAYDPNVRLALWNSVDEARACLERMAGFAEFLLPSRQDLETLYGVSDPAGQLARLTRFGAAEIALTCDTDGGWLWSEGRESRVPPHAVRAIDTSGAGDAFNGSYLAARLQGASPATAAAAGQRLAARVVQCRGAIIPADQTPAAELRFPSLNRD